MNGMIELFDRKERTVLSALAAFLLLSLAAFAVVELGERNGYERALSETMKLEKDFKPLDAKRNGSRADWQVWDASRRDLKEIRNGWFYAGGEAAKLLSLDVRKLLADSGMTAPDFKYDYQDAGSGRLKKIAVSFLFSGSYPELRKFLDTVERFPKFLMIDDVEFVKNYENVNRLDVKITMAGYCED